MAIGGAILVGMGVMSALGALYPPLGRWSQQYQNKKVRNSLPDIFSLADMYARGSLDDSDYYDSAHKLGFTSEWANQFAHASQQYLTITDYVAAWRRGIMSENELEQRLLELKIEPRDFEHVKKVTEYFPNPQDLVRFAVREVYTPETVSQFGMMEDLPDEFLNESQKAGLPEDQARNFWAAHWQLPSIGQGFEMFQRRVIDQKTLNMLLRSLDVMPFWRDKLTSISYNPLTRVDVRRMYSLGVLDEQGVYDSYLDAGYSPENAQAMLDFTVQYENDEYKGISRSQVVNAYEDSLISREELIEMLQGMRYSQNVVDFWVATADYEKTQRIFRELADEIKDQYRLGQLTLDQAKAVLLSQDVPATYAESVIQSLVVSQAQRRKKPSKTDLEGWLDYGIVDEQYFSDGMRLLGYSDEDILLYITHSDATRARDTRHFLSDTKYIDLYKQLIIDKELFAKTMRAKGTAASDIEALINEVEGDKDES